MANVARDYEADWNEGLQILEDLVNGWSDGERYDRKF